MENKIKLNGALRDILLEGATIIAHKEGQYCDSVLVQNPKGKEFKFAIYRNVTGIDSDDKMLTQSLNYTRGKAIKEFEYDFFSTEFHCRRYKEKYSTIR